MTPGKIDQLNIAHFVHFMGHGGLENRINRMFVAWQDRPIQFTVFSLRPADKDSHPLQLPPNVTHIPLNLPPGTRWSTITHLADTLKSRQIHISHSHNWVSMAEGIVAAKLARTPLVFHGEHGAKAFEPGETRVHRTIAQGLLAHGADRIVCVNEPIRQRLQQLWRMASHRLEVIPNGVDLGRFAPRASERKRLVVGSVGRLAAVKDFATLVRAVAVLRDKSPAIELQCVIYGSGPEQVSLSRLISSLSLGEQVILAGPTDTPEACYGEIDVFVNSSLSEGMSNTLLEAMACGLPLVCSDIKGNRSWLRDNENCRFFPRGDAEGLAAILSDLSTRADERRRFGHNNRARVEKEFDNHFFLERYAALYRQQLAAKGFGCDFL